MSLDHLDERPPLLFESRHKTGPGSDFKHLGKHFSLATWANTNTLGACCKAWGLDLEDPLAFLRACPRPDALPRTSQC
eukprot:706867-Prorocentrum_minimum.AAC.1